MCGNGASLFVASIEGTEMKVCKECCGFGKVIGPVQAEKKSGIEKQKITLAKTFSQVWHAQEDKEMLIVENFASIMRKKREQLGLTQKEFANMLSERESLIQKIETGSYEPDIGMARKFERLLKIRLVDEYEEKRVRLAHDASSQITIGDMVTLKKRK